MRGPFCWSSQKFMFYFCSAFCRFNWGRGVASFYRDEDCEVTDAAVKTATATYPLEEIVNLRAEHRLWNKESEPTLALLSVGFVWFFVDLVERVVPVLMYGQALSVWGYVMVFLIFTSCVLLFMAGMRLVRGKKYHLTFKKSDENSRQGRLVTLVEADALEPLERIALVIRDAQMALKQRG